tara:strand:- start:513 stop:746 length:234 start_codon:yes stop_codon:yes gene_type:complete
VNVLILIKRFISRKEKRTKKNILTLNFKQMKKSFKVFSRVMAIAFALLILMQLMSCGSTSGCSSKATNRGGGYYINR